MKDLAIPLLLAVLSLVACAASDPPPQSQPAKTTAPVSLDTQGNTDWIHRSQYKGHMRHMWLDANRVVGAGSGTKQPAWAELEAFSQDILWRAELFSRHWKSLRDQADEALLALNDQDRIGLTTQIHAMGVTCDSCHSATWSPWYLRVNDRLIHEWKRNEPRPHITENADPVPPPRIAHREEMARLCDLEVEQKDALQRWDLPTLEGLLKQTREISSVRAGYWERVVSESGTIQSAARSRDREMLRAAYDRMRETCVGCHASYAGEVREIHNPVPWKD